MIGFACLCVGVVGLAFGLTGHNPALDFLGGWLILIGLGCALVRDSRTNAGVIYGDHDYLDRQRVGYRSEDGA